MHCGASTWTIYLHSSCGRTYMYNVSDALSFHFIISAALSFSYCFISAVLSI